MKQKTKELILETWDRIEEEDPDKSTEYIMARVEDELRAVHGLDVDAGDISEVLSTRSDAVSTEDEDAF